MIVATAPGRVNLIGEHTDYNGGLVLPTPIPQQARVDLERRADDRVIVWSRELGTWGNYRLGHERHSGRWLDYIQGCTAVLREAGHHLGGAELRIRSEVPLGGGLSSSAALEVAVLRALRDAFELQLDDVALALLGQRAETELVGTPAGAMDQLVASLGRAGMALFVDMQSLDARLVPLRDADLIVISSGISYDQATGDHRTRRAECEAAAAALEVASLREITIDDPRIAELPAPLDRRVRHVVTENARVLATVDAFARDDLATAGELFRASHVSLRDDYAVSIPAIDALVAIADRDPDVYGSRLTGIGFGGSIVALARRGGGPRAATRIAARYLGDTGRRARVLVAGEVPCARS